MSEPSTGVTQAQWSDLADVIRRTLHGAEGVAIHAAGRVLDWRELAQRVAAIDDELGNLGIGPGAVVAIPGRNERDCAVAALAMIATDRCPAIVNPFQPAAAILAAARAYRPDAILLFEDDAAIDEATADDPVLVMRRSGGISRHRQGVLRQTGGTSGIVIATSGTTGDPKPVVLSKATLSRAIPEIVSFNEGFGDRRRESGEWPPLIQYSPLAHIAGALTLLRAAAQGRPTVLLEKFDPSVWADQVEEFGLYTTGLPPTMMRMVLEARVPAERLSSLVSVWSGSAPIRQSDMDLFSDRYGLPVLGNYGATEFCGAIAAWTLADHRAFFPARRDAVGRICPNVAAVRVRGPGGAILSEEGQVGTLEFQVHRIGREWIATSDRGSVDRDGFLVLQGRNDDFIIRGGFKLAPRQIADVLRQHPLIRDAAVVGVPDPRLGHVPVAAVELDGGQRVAESELLDFVRARLPAYFVPVAVRTLRQLPRTVAMKLDRRAIAALFEEQ